MHVSVHTVSHITKGSYDLLLFDFIEVKIPDAQRPTRDIVFARIKIKDQILNIFVNQIFHNRQDQHQLHQS